MQVKCGTDLIRIERISQAIARIGTPFLYRIWTAEELGDCLPADFTPGEALPGPAAASLAARFTAKEAMAKALGTGIGPMGVGWTDVSVRRTEHSAAPEVCLTGEALSRYKSLGGESISISLTHDGPWAMAFCVLLLQSGEQDCMDEEKHRDEALR